MVLSKPWPAAVVCHSPIATRGSGRRWWIELVALCWTHRVNVNRLHGARHYRSPTEHEDDYHRQNDSQQQPLPGEPGLHQLRCAPPNKVLLQRSDTPANPRRTAELDETLTNS